MSIEIKEKSRDFDKVEIYLMTSAPDIPSIKDIEDGTKIDVDGYIIFNDIKVRDGEEETSTILSIITPNKEVYSCQSKTFRESFIQIYELMDGEPFAVKKISGKTKNNRDYINCTLWV